MRARTRACFSTAQCAAMDALGKSTGWKLQRLSREKIKIFCARLGIDEARGLPQLPCLMAGCRVQHKLSGL